MGIKWKVGVTEKNGSWKEDTGSSFQPYRFSNEETEAPKAEVIHSQSLCLVGAKLELDLKSEDHSPLFFLLRHLVSSPGARRVYHSNQCGAVSPQNESRTALVCEERGQLGKVQCLGYYFAPGGPVETWNCHKVTQGNRLKSSLHRSVGWRSPHRVVGGWSPHTWALSFL